MEELETLVKGELDWHNKVNSNFSTLNAKKIGIENLIASTSYGVLEGLTVSAQSTPNMSVNAASGKVDMPNGIELTPTGNNNLAIDAANSTDARIDIVYVKSDGSIGYTAGTPSSTPTAPVIPDGVFLLYKINVGAGVTAITNSDLVDMRKSKITIDDIAGSGRTNETVKKNADDIKTLGTQMADIMPVGSIIWYAKNDAPEGYLKANGALVSRTAYSNLFVAIGTTYGAGDGSTTFQLPDLRGQFIRGFDDGAGIDSGRSFGSLQSDDFKTHSHTALVAENYSTGGQNWDLIAGVYSGNWTAKSVSSTGNSGIQANGGIETRPKNIALMPCIKY